MGRVSPLPPQLQAADRQADKPAQAKQEHAEGRATGGQEDGQEKKQPAPDIKPTPDAGSQSNERHAAHDSEEGSEQERIIEKDVDTQDGQETAIVGGHQRPDLSLGGS